MFESITGNISPKHLKNYRICVIINANYVRWEKYLQHNTCYVDKCVVLSAKAVSRFSCGINDEMRRRKI